MTEDDEITRLRKDPRFRELVEDLRKQSSEQLERLIEYLEEDEEGGRDQDTIVPGDDS